jgi:Ca2+-transporting ATPase
MCLVQQHEQTRWYAVPADEVLSRLETSLDGLSEEEVDTRLEKHGPNIVRSGRETSPWTILRNQIASPLIYILLAAMAVTLAIQHWADAIVIGAVVALNTVIGFVQEYRAENAIQALIGLAAPRATVRRQGREQRVDASNPVPGDIVLSEAGSIVPADLRLVESTRFQVDEALLFPIADSAIGEERGVAPPTCVQKILLNVLETVGTDTD